MSAASKLKSTDCKNSSATKKHTRAKPPASTPSPSIPVDVDALKAKIILDPSFMASAIIDVFCPAHKEEKPKGLAMVDQLGEHIKRVQANDLSGVEAMLVSQAHTLGMVFNALAGRAAENMTQHLDAFERYLRLALKAQGQCRATLETLAVIKNPQPTAFIRQQNIAANQQVNNTQVLARTHGDSTNSTNELSSLTHEQRQRLDLSAPQATSQGDPTLGTVDSIHRTKDSTGKSKGSHERHKARAQISIERGMVAARRAGAQRSQAQ